MSSGALQGIEEFGRMVEAIADGMPREVITPAVNAGLGVIAGAMRGASPAGNIRRSVGKRTRRRGETVQGKAGFDVAKPPRRRGKRKYTTAELLSGQAPHSHLYFLGTKQRRRDKIGGKYSYVERRGHSPGLMKHKRRTGASPAHPGMQGVINSSLPQATQAMVEASRKALDRLAAGGK